MCCLGGVKVRATWQPADSRRTVGGAMILLTGVAKVGLGSGSGGADQWHLGPIPSRSQRVSMYTNLSIVGQSLLAPNDADVTTSWNDYFS